MSCGQKYKKHLRYFIELSYNGRDYHGWQSQPNALSVQEVIEKSLSTLLGAPISLTGAGRTDAGVHAKQMFAHFDTGIALVETDVVYKLNAFLPKDIAIHNLFQVKAHAHARFDAISRTYLYRIALKKNAFTGKEAYYVKQQLNISKMQEASKILFDYKDFKCFSKSNTDVKTYHCTVMACDWVLKEDELQLWITADRFLRNMVRAIVGTMIGIGTEKIMVEDLHQIIQSKDRSEAGYSVPAHALYLTAVAYPDDIKL